MPIYCHEDCKFSEYIPKLDQWVCYEEDLEQTQDDPPVVLWDIKVCPKCMRRLVPNGEVMEATGWEFI